MTRRSLPQFSPRRAQRGAVLYVALIMLILLAMIGIVGMQVTGMQERMSSNYRSANLAFQNAEGDARRVECFIEATVNRTTTACPTVTIDTCSAGFDASSWAQGHAFATPAADRVSVRAIGPCISGDTTLRMGGEIDENPNPIYQITVYATDLPDASGADAAIDTIFRP